MPSFLSSSKQVSECRTLGAFCFHLRRFLFKYDKIFERRRFMTSHNPCHGPLHDIVNQLRFFQTKRIVVQTISARNISVYHAHSMTCSFGFNCLKETLPGFQHVFNNPTAGLFTDLEYLRNYSVFSGGGARRTTKRIMFYSNFSTSFSKMTLTDQV